MTIRPHRFPILLLATAMGLTLSACGGERAPSTYRGEGVEARTVMSGQRHANNNSPLVARVERLEQDVALLKNDLGQLAMNYNGVMATNERIDALIAHMEEEQRRAPAPVVEKAAPKPVVAVAPVPKPDTKPAPAKGPVVQGVRLGEHENATRLVIDWSQLGDVKTDLDNDEKILLVTLSKTAWEAKTNVSGLSSPLVSGWSVDDNNGGKILAIQLKKPVSVKNIGKLKAEGGKAGRVVIDLAAR